MAPPFPVLASRRPLAEVSVREGEMRFTNITAFAAAFCLALPIAAFAQGAEEESTHQIAGEEEPAAPTLAYRTGDVELPNKIAKKKDQTL
jgi:hypothetical protein